MKQIKFEMDIIDSRGNCFDHHGDITHSNAFIGKMASVQLLEKMLITGEDLIEDDYANVELNHVGHLDDFILHAILPAKAVGKLRNLYAWATRISVLDSCGPSGYKLLQVSDRKFVEGVYDYFQEQVSAFADIKELERWELTLEDRIPCSKATGNHLVQYLCLDDYTEPEAWEPPEDSYKIVKKEGDVWLIRSVDSGMNPLRASGYFYNQGCKVMIAYRYQEDIERYTYSVAARSPYDEDLTPLWPMLSALETTGQTWGGHSGAGGSPRKSDDFEGGSILVPLQVLETYKVMT